jgi:hypothetical protein
MAGNENRKRSNQLRDIAKELLDTQLALAQTISIVEQLTAAHNALQGVLLATGVLSEKNFAKKREESVK